MNKQLFSLSVFALLTTGASAQITTNTVSLGAGYVNQKWYSLENGEVATQPKDNWDIAFEASGYSSAILANTQKANFALYRAPFKMSDYSILDTTGISTWPLLYNSDTTWTVGAFNKGAILSNPYDLGWGIYDMNTHFVNGDSCFVVKLSAISYKKLKIVSLANGVYNFEYADLNGANSFTQAVTKATYATKNFVYFDMTGNAVVDREPTTTSWDFTFAKYTAYLSPSTPYGVSGIVQNKGVNVAQANNVAAPATYTAWSTEVFNTNITTIGHDWKTYNGSGYSIVNDTLYFVKDKAGSIWKVRPVGFSLANGDFIFSKEKLAASTVGISEAGIAISEVAVYPNPSNGSNTTLVFSNTKSQSVSVSIVDMNGKVISTQGLEVAEGLTTHALNTQSLQAGIYFVKLNTASYSTTQKLIIQ